jgi:hypothetical protein
VNKQHPTAIPTDLGLAATHAERPDLTEGTKLDAGKSRHDLIAPELPHYLGLVQGFGAVKYEARNWEKGMKWGRPFAAAMRHLWKWWGGERCDAESGLPHLAHAACMMMYLLAYEERGLGDDDRYKAPPQAPDVGT